MTYKFTSDNCISIPKAAFDRLHAASEFDLRVLFVLSSMIHEGGSADSAAIAASLNTDSAEVAASLGFWRGAGVIAKIGVAENDISLRSEQSPSSKSSLSEVNSSDRLFSQVHSNSNIAPPTYTGAEIEHLFMQKSSLRILINECQNLTEKMFSPSEVSKVVALSDFLSLSDEYILLLFSHFKELDKTSVSYIVKAAYNLVKEGIETYSDFEAYIRTKEEVKTLEGRIRTLIGAQNRTLGKKERDHIAQWSAKGYDFDKITAAYDETVDKIHKVSFPYMSKILENDNKTEKPKKKSKQLSQSSFDADEFFQAALEASKAKYIAEQSEEEAANE